MLNHIIILFIAVLERSHIVEYVVIFNYEKNPNIDQDINNFMYSRLPNNCRISDFDCRTPKTLEVKQPCHLNHPTCDIAVQ